jgi:hypothetical protein
MHAHQCLVKSVNGRAAHCLRKARRTPTIAKVVTHSINQEHILRESVQKWAPPVCAKCVP